MTLALEESLSQLASRLNTIETLIAGQGSGFTNPMTTAADLIVGGVAGAPSRLGKGSDSQVLTVDPVTHLLSWKTPTTGTVTSVGLTAPAEFTVSGSPVTGTGSLAFAKATQVANRIYSGPASGADAAPAFRALVALDIPAIAQSGVTNLVSDLAAKAALASPTFTGIPVMPVLSVTGLTGAVSATRYVGGTASVAPTTGTFVAGDFVISLNGSIWICTVGGSPGTWVLHSSSTPWTTWTPSVTQGATPTQSVSYARYAIVNGVTIAEFRVDFTGNGTGGSNIIITTPTTMVSSSTNAGKGTGVLLDSSAGITYVGCLQPASSTTQMNMAVDGGILLGSNPAVTIATGDRFGGVMIYE